MTLHLHANDRNKHTIDKQTLGSPLINALYQSLSNYQIMTGDISRTLEAYILRGRVGDLCEQPYPSRCGQVRI